MNIRTVQTSPDCSMEYSDSGRGHILLLLHAFPLCWEAWRPQIEVLQDNYRVIAPSQRGFGGTSSFGSTPSIEQMADDVAALLGALQITEPIVVGGLSMGGYVAMHFARKYPHRLRGLILCDTRAEPDTTEGKAKRGEMIAFAESHTPREVVEKVMPTLTGETTRRKRSEVVAEILRIGSAQPRTTIIAALQALRDRPDARPWLSSVKVPTLVIVGNEDTLTPPPVAQALVELIPAATLSVIEAAGHLSNLEQPQAFNQTLQLFLENIQ